MRQRNFSNSLKTNISIITLEEYLILNIWNDESLNYINDFNQIVICNRMNLLIKKSCFNDISYEILR